MKMRAKPLATLCWICMLAACSGGPDGPPPTLDVDIVRAYPNLRFDRPLMVKTAPGDTQRLYVAEQGGLIRVFDGRDDDVLGTNVFLDLRNRTRANREQGLLGLAFDPNYPVNGRVYVNYSDNATLADDVPGDTVVASFVANPASGTVDRTTETELLRYSQPRLNHNGGSIEFGADDMLYIASGDGGGGNDPDNNAQDRTNLLGKILRIEPDGSIPTDNPFVGMGAFRGEIWVYGLRNPFRMAFDPPTGRLWIGDVGQGAQEEINIVEATGGGSNYGWRVFEGTRCNTNVPNTCDTQSDPSGQGFTAPIHTYAHPSPTDGRSVTGGRVYRGTAIPELRGRYVHGDFITGTISALSLTGDRMADNLVLGQTAGARFQGPSSFGTDLSGEILITAFDGTLQRIVPR